MIEIFCGKNIFLKIIIENWVSLYVLKHAWRGYLKPHEEQNYLITTFNTQNKLMLTYDLYFILLCVFIYLFIYQSSPLSP